jgi:16S rRNA (uracil1498-N3)-methyltransferase
MGYVAVTLGERILRTDTAGPAIVAMLQYALGDLGGVAR